MTANQTCPRATVVLSSPGAVATFPLSDGLTLPVFATVSRVQDDGTVTHGPHVLAGAAYLKEVAICSAVLEFPMCALVR